MTYEFEGKTEKEAIDNAVQELGLEQDQFDVEILESQKNSLFKKGYVKICVHTLDSGDGAKGATQGPCGTVGNEGGAASETGREGRRGFDEPVERKVTSEVFEANIVSFVQNVIEKMGYKATVTVTFHEEHKLGIKIDSDSSSILIGRKGANLDAMQLLTNVYATKMGYPDVCVVLDSEGYRVRREESLVHLAYNVADRVHETRRSVLLEPMNSYERRIIHTTLGDIPDIETISEGDGAYKRVRIMCKRYR